MNEFYLYRKVEKTLWHYCLQWQHAPLSKYGHIIMNHAMNMAMVLIIRLEGHKSLYMLVQFGIFMAATTQKDSMQE